MTKTLAVGRRGAFLLLAAVGLALVHIRRPTTFCLLRATTGVPCPFCGGTTAAVDVGRADLLAALRASPLAVLGAAVFVLSPRLPRPALTQRQLWTAIVLIGVAAELWQLARYGVI